MTAVAFCPVYDRAGDGYAVFRHAADKWARMHDATVYEIPAAKMSGTVPLAAKAHEIHARAKFVFDAIGKMAAPITDIAFFNHGWRTGMQTLYDLATIKDFVHVVTPKAALNLRVWLYACACIADKTDGKWKPSRTGTGDGSVADEMRDEFCRCGITSIRVDAHATAGHATGNPFIKRCEGPTPGVGGEWIVSPFSDLWQPFCEAIAHTDLEFNVTKIDADKVRLGLGALGMNRK